MSEVSAGDSVDAGDTSGAQAAQPQPESANRREGVDAGGVPGISDLEQEGEVAADYLEEFLDICDVDGDLDLDVEGDRALVAIVGSGLDHLVGPHGEVLEALQELTRLAVLAATGRRSRLMLDVAGYRARRRSELHALGTAAAERVAGGGEREVLAPMSAFERKVVHDAVAQVVGAHSESEGEEPQRRVVVLPG